VKLSRVIRLSTNYHEDNPNAKVTMPSQTKKKGHLRLVRPRLPEVLDVQMTAAMLTVSPDTVYDLFASGELPGRKVGRKWITTKAAVLRWIESTSTDDTLVRAIKRGNGQALRDALNTGAVRIKPKG
jgi:excisionase family DNA binding protein